MVRSAPGRDAPRGRVEEDTDEIRVLHVDDDPEFAELTATFLERESDRFTVEIATDVETALDHVDRSTVDCVVSDYDMPGQSGIDLLRALRERGSDVPFILFTGKGSEEVASEAISAGVDDYLQKRAGSDQYPVLARRIENLVSGYRTERELERSEERYRKLVDEAPVPIVLYTTEGEVIYANDAAVSFFEAGERAALLGKRATEFVPPDRRGTVEERIARLGEDGESLPPIEQTVVGLDGTHRHGVVASSRVTFGGEPVIQTVIHDVTGQTRRERILEELNAVATDLGECETVEAICDRTVAAAETVLDLRLCVVNLERDGVLEVTATSEGVADGDVTSMRTDEGLLGKTYRTGESYLIDDISHVEEAKPQGPYQSFISVPMGDHGVFQAVSEERSAFDETDLEFAELLVAHAVQALDRLARARESRWRQRVMEEAPVGITVTDATEADNPIVFANDRFLEITGYEREDVIGRNCRFLQGEGSDPGTVETLRSAIEHGEPVSVELRNYRADGSPFWNRLSVAPVRDETGERTHYVGFQEDITERRRQNRRAERLRHAAEELVRAGTNEEIAEITVRTARQVFDLPLSGVHLIDEEGEVLEGVAVTDEVNDVLGGPPSYPRSGEGAAAVVWEVFESGETTVIEDVTEHERLGGEDTPVRSGLIEPLGEHGVLILSAPTPEAVSPGARALLDILASTVTDALDRVAREEALRNERDRLVSLFEVVPEPAVYVRFEDGEPIVEDANAAFEETFGYEGEAIVGRSINELIVPSDRHEAAGAIDEAIRSAGAVTREVQRETPDGPREFLLTTVPVDADGGEEYFAIYIDISEQRAREAELERRNERLGEFASIVSHDLRNPLNVAQGRLTLAMEECESEHLETVERAHARMEELIEDLLTLAKSGEAVAETERVELDLIATACWQNVSTSGADLEVQSDLTVEADEGRLRQLLENLIRNAVEHAGPDVTVRVGDLDDGRGFYVEDDGPGIPEDDRERVFESGYSTAESGTGFGLSIVREIAEAHGWDVVVTESEDGGARFEITGVTPE